MGGGARDGLREIILLVFFLDGRYFGLSPPEFGEAGSEEGGSILWENMLVDRATGGLEEVGRDLKYDLIVESLTFFNSGELESGCFLLLEGFPWCGVRDSMISLSSGTGKDIFDGRDCSFPRCGVKDSSTEGSFTTG